MASVNSVSRMANSAARHRRPSPARRCFQTMQTLITATHGRPVQYSQDHAYRQEAPTRLPPFLPRRGLVEPYRPLGPLPPRAVRAVARLGPHPVADGHLVDVAALAAPPCGLAAYGPRGGGLQPKNQSCKTQLRRRRSPCCPRASGTGARCTRRGIPARPASPGRTR